MFNAILIEKDDKGYRSALTQLEQSQLPEGDVTVQVEYSSLNYKDGLAISGKSPVVRQFPMIPGIDLAGTVIESQSALYNVGDKVLLNGWGVGEKHWGGLAQLARLNSQWLIPLPQQLTTKECMAIGTAGYTAILAVIALEKHGISPDKGKIIVTGANGGVGSFAIAILAQLGYHVIASTGRTDQTVYLTQLGASEIIDRNELSQPGKPLMKERWIGAVDCVGGHTLANVCASTQYGGTVACCGLAQSIDFPSSVAPFILRGITLAGIDSVMRPYADRIDAWERLATILDESKLDLMSKAISLTEVITTVTQLMQGQIRGRIIVDVNQ